MPYAALPDGLCRALHQTCDVTQMKVNAVMRTPSDPVFEASTATGYNRRGNTESRSLRPFAAESRVLMER
jgi:hypothetical protein